jgi:chromosome segregation ATPase
MDMTDDDVDDLEEIMTKVKLYNRLQAELQNLQGRLEEKLARVETLSGEVTLKRAVRCLERRRKHLEENTRERLKRLQEWEEKWKEVLP